MPVMDGITCTQEIRKLKNGNSHCTIIALTANVLKDDQIKCFKAGMNDFLSKPISIERLGSILSKWLTDDASLQINS